MAFVMFSFPYKARILIRKGWRSLAVVLWVMHCASAMATSVAFINPGKAGEHYWTLSAERMEQAARQLGMRLEVLNAERNHFKALALVRQLAERRPEDRPQYVVMTNDYGVGPEILRLLDGKGIFVFMAFSALHGPVRAEIGPPRGRYSFWLGSLEPQAEEAGYQTAQALIRRARAAQKHSGSDAALQLLSIAGDRSTPSSMARNAGMRRAVAEAGDVQLLQEVYGGWNEDKAREQARWLFARYPGARLLWAGNDLMAFGAMEAWRERGGMPGVDGFFSGVNSSPEALARLRNGELTALSGGHFMTGAWAMVMLYDHSRGVDFASEGLEQQHPLFISFDKDSAERYEKLMRHPATAVDFRQFSKVLNPRVKRYNFATELWLHGKGRE